MGPIPVPIVIASDQIMWAWTVAYIIKILNGIDRVKKVRNQAVNR